MASYDAESNHSVSSRSFLDDTDMDETYNPEKDQDAAKDRESDEGDGAAHEYGYESDDTVSIMANPSPAKKRKERKEKGDADAPTASRNKTWQEPELLVIMQHLNQHGHGLMDRKVGGNGPARDEAFVGMTGMYHSIHLDVI